MEAADSLPVTAATRWTCAAKRAGTHSLLIWPPIAAVWVFIVALRKQAVALDFHYAYLPAARAVLEGHSPYPPATITALAPKMAFVYPPITAYLATPFTVLPPTIADTIATLLAIGCVLAILWLLGVRDWRCYAIPILWAPTYSAIQTANVMLPLAVGLAVVWRLRRHAVAAAVVTGSLIAVKLLVWPVLVWLVATRRYKAAAWGVAAAAVLILGPWAAIHFAGLTEYPHLLRVLTEVERGDGYTIPALIAPGVSWQVANVVGLSIGLAVLALVILNRRDERRAFALAIAATLLLTPIVSMNYYVLLIVVLALFTPRFGWVWVLPLLFWISPQSGNGAVWQTAAGLAVAAGIFCVAVRGRHVAAARMT
jgi:alpha-1,2-mannosyltransferase